MISKHILKEYVEATMEQEESVDELSRVLQLFSDDNSVTTLMKYRLYSAIDDIILEVMGQSKFNTLMWWMYECIDRNGIRTAVIETDGIKHDVTDFDAFYDLLLVE